MTESRRSPSHDLYRRVILFPCAKFHWNRTTGSWVMVMSWKWRPSAVLSFNHFHTWSSWLSSSSKCAFVVTTFIKSDFSLRYTGSDFTICNIEAVRRLEFWKCSCLVTWLSSRFNSKVYRSVPNFTKIVWFFVEISRFYDFQDGGSSPKMGCLKSST